MSKITLRDLEILDAFAENMAYSRGALGRQSKDSVGYVDMVNRFNRAAYVYRRYLSRLKTKCTQNAVTGV